MSFANGLALATMFAGLIGMVVIGVDLVRRYKKLKEKKK